MNKGRAVYLFASLFIIGCLLIGCIDPVSSSKKALENGAAAEPGYGKVAITINGAAERTIFPEMALFARYEYAFASVIGSTVEPPKLQEPEEDNLFTLKMGYWRVMVLAYINMDDTDPAATGTSETFIVGDGIAEVLVRLSGEKDEGEGTFSYYIEYPERAELTVFLLEDLLRENAIDLSSAEGTADNANIILAGTETLPAGVYYLTIALETDGAKTGVNEVVYIYDKLDSEYSIDFSEKDYFYSEAINALSIGGVTPPATLTEPVTEIPETDQYTITVTWEPEDFNDDGSFKGGVQYTATITLTPKDGYTLYDMDEGSFAVEGAETVNPGDSGVITAVFPATEPLVPIADDFTVDGTGTFTYDGSAKAVNVTVADGKSPGAITVLYNEAEVQPVHFGSYTVTFNVAAVPPNWAAVDGLAAGNITINPKEATLSVTNTIAAQTYTGSAHTPAVTVTDGETELAITDDYTVGYSNNINAGTATVTIYGEGNYAGNTGSATFTINKAAGLPVAAIASTSLTGTEITLTAVTAPGNGQTVEYAMNIANDTTGVTWQDDTTFSGLSVNTTYYFFARSKANDNYNAGTPSSSISVTTNKNTGVAVSSAPTEASKTATGITVNTVTITASNPGNQSVEYSRSEAGFTTSNGAWQVDTTFDGLSVYTTYYFFARSKENNAYYAGAASSGTAITTNKNTGATVSGAPTEASKTANSVTLNMVTIPTNPGSQTVEYAMNTANNTTGVTWQDGRTFSGLSAVTNYYFFARSAENATYYAGAASSSTQITTPKNPAPSLSAPTAASITQTGVTLNTITVSTGQTVEYAMNGSNTAPSSGWQTSTAFSGLSVNSTYYFFARVTDSATYLGVTSSGAQIKTNNLNAGSNVSGAPTEASKTANSITVNAVTLSTATGQSIEYGINNSNSAPSAWQTGTTFSGLNPGTTYYLFARSAENGSYNPGAASSGTAITTAKGTGAVASRPSNTATITATSITLTAVAAPSNGQVVEYAINTTDSSTGVTWQTNTLFNNLTPGTTYYFFARAKENDNYNAGAISQSRSFTTSKGTGATATRPSSTATITATSITLTASTLSPTTNQVVEYAINTSNSSTGVTWQTNTLFNNLTAVTTYYFFARSASNDNYNAGAISQSRQLTTIKNTGATASRTPSSPASSTATSITVTASTITTNPGNQTVEYARNGSNTAPTSGWQDSTTFSGLTAGTTYYFFARSKENDTYYAGSASTGRGITTPAKATVTISAPAATSGNIGTNQITLTAVTPSPNTTTTSQTVEYSRSNAGSTTSNGTWQENRSFSSLTAGTTYYFFARVTANDNYAGATSSGTAITTTKNAGSAVSGAPTVSGTPTADSITVNTVTLSTATGQSIEYGINTTNTAPTGNTNTNKWQTGTTFNTGLSVGTTYYFFARSQENNSYSAGTASSGRAISTAKGTGSAVSGAPNATTGNIAATQIVLTPVTLSTATGQTIEYARNSSNSAPTSGWQTSTTFSGLSAVTQYYFFARSASNDNYNAGTASSGRAITTIKNPGASLSAPTAASTTATSITLTAQTASTGQTVEYARNGTSTAPTSGWQTSTSFTGLTINTSYYFFARAVENATYLGTTSSGRSITTSGKTAVTISAPTATSGNIGTTQIVLTAVTPSPNTATTSQTVQYARNTSNSSTNVTWQNSTTFSSLTANTTYYFFARVQENDNYLGATSSPGTAIKTNAAVSAAAVPYFWNFQDSVSGWTDDGSSPSTNNTTDASNGNNMTLLGATVATRLATARSNPTGASSGCIQPNGAGNFLKIVNVPGPFKLDVIYTDTGDSSTGRSVDIYIGGSRVVQGSAGSGSSSAKTVTYTHTASTNVDIQLYSVGGGVRVYDVKLTTPPVLVTGINIGSNFSINVGATQTLTATITPNNATDKTVTWSSGNTARATVNASGVVTGVSAGTATITATANDGSGRSASVTATITALNTSSLSIIESGGWTEAAFVKFNKPTNGSPYTVAYQKSGTSTWTNIDEQLIRDYGGYMRADVVGISSGTYSIRVTPNSGTAATVSNIAVTAHDRSGFAFTGGNIPGGYNTDGTPKTGARIIYVADSNKATVSLNMKDGSSSSANYTGLYTIMKVYEKGYEDRPTIIRLLGKINEPTSGQKGDGGSSGHFTDSEGTVMIKGSSSRAPGMNLTFEGVGNDTTAYGWGFRTSRADHLEIRNIAFMLSNTSQKDSVEVAAQSSYIWVHNCEFFYGMPGSASDQVKGDGTLDTKRSQNISYSYNHFWDSGKSNLLGNGDESSYVGKLTYHHNWYDHSDSRHPRIRDHKVHVYNNYYKGVSKYGVGATQNSSVFVERNVFEMTKKPMLISMQGSDVANGDSGTFSKEDGGIIKAFGNFMDTYSQGYYRPYNSSSNTVEFDAYEVSSRTTPVPTTVKTKQGAHTYDNDFIPSSGYTANIDAAEATIKANVTKYAGRYYGGDFSYTFGSNEYTNSDIIPALKTALQNYTNSLVSVQGLGTQSGGTPSNTAVTLNSVTANGSSSSTTTQLTLTFNASISGLAASNITLSGVSGVSKGTLSGSGSSYTLGISGFTAGGTLNVAVSAPSGYTISGSPKTVTIYYYNSSGGGGNVTGQVTCAFGMTTNTGSSIYATNDGFTLASASGTKPSGGTTINGTAYDVALKIESSTTVTFTTTAAMTLTLYTDQTSSGKRIKVDGTDRTTDSSGVVTVTGLAAGTHTITKNDTMNLWLITLAP